MAGEQTMCGFRREARRLGDVMLALGEADFGRPTGCPPWTVKELFAHVRGAIGRIETMLAAPAQPRATPVSAMEESGAALISAAAYYRPDERFSAETDSERIASAQRAAAAQASGHALAIAFDRAWRGAAVAIDKAPADRVVRTRHGDWMRLTDFLVTRVVELAVHGLDVAAALDRDPWLTPEAGDVVEELLLGNAGAQVREALGWDQLTLIRKATGREAVTQDEIDRLARLDVQWLAFGPRAA